MLRYIVPVGVVLTMSATQLSAQSVERKYVAGMRSALIMGSMDLSGVDPAFANLPYDGPQGPHMSGFFLLYKVRPQLRVGIETLVSNSDQKAATTMNYQAAGPVVEFSYGRSWFISGGVHMGGLIVNAMARNAVSSPERATIGAYYKGNGLFVAPSIDLGVRFRRGELGAFVKQVNISGGNERKGMSGFSATFAGLRVGVGL